MPNDLNEFLEEELGGEQNEGAETGAGKQRPAFRVVQPERDRDGKTNYLEVGQLWKNVSKAGKEYYTLKIGNLRLLVFPNK